MCRFVHYLTLDGGQLSVAYTILFDFMITVHMYVVYLLTQFYSFGLSNDDAILAPPSVDVLSPPIVLSESFYFFGQAIETVYVS